MQLILLVLTLISVTGLAQANILEEQPAERSLPLKFQYCPDSFLHQRGFYNLFLTRRGCCSHHSGVCGCKGNRQECCDGTLSPSCRCFSDGLQREKIRKTQ